MKADLHRRFYFRSGVAGVSLAFAAAFSSSAASQVLPSAAIVENGQVGVSAVGDRGLIVNQSSANAIISWESFSIGRDSAVHFNNGAGATLNRVRGNIGSQIDGGLSATGSLYLVNPAGITVGVSGRVETGGHFFASTQDISNDDFAKAARGESFTLRGTSGASVINAGRIGAHGGDIVLVAKTVENSGELSAPNGTAALLAGSEVLVQDRTADNGQFVVKVGGAGTSATNRGSIKATQVELRANGGNVYALAGNRDGVIAATGTSARQGRVFLTAGDSGTVEVSGRVTARQTSIHGAEARNGGQIRVSGRNVKISGTLDASGLPAPLPPERPDGLPTDGDGGRIIVTGHEIALASGARVDVSGERGGIALIGGDYQGGADPSRKFVAESVATAQTLTVASSATISANGRLRDGGNIVLWADGHTDFAGNVSATSITGFGGQAEVSGKTTLSFNGTSTLLGGKGAGTLLLDPYNLTIVAGSGGGVTSSASVSTLGADTLTALLASQSVIVRTGGYVGDGAGNGDITVNAVINWGTAAPGGTSLTLLAHNNIIVNANITATDDDSTVTLHADADGTGNGTVSFGAGNVSASKVSILYNPAGGYTAPQDAAFSAHATNLTAYMLVNNVDDLQRVGHAVNGNLAGTYALGRDIDASITANPASSFGPSGFMPIGSNITPFTGIFDGRGHVIKGLTINRPATDYVGLFGAVAGTGADPMSLVSASVLNVGLEGGSITGRDHVGALVGSILRDTYITAAYASTNVTGRNNVGGLLGSMQAIGGVATANITRAYAAGTVTASGVKAGGFVGVIDDGGITDAYAIGAVTGNDEVGGFGGYFNKGVVTRIYSTGLVTGTGGNTAVGGLIGYFKYEDSWISAGFWDKSLNPALSIIGATSGPSPDLVKVLDSTTAYKAAEYSVSWAVPMPGSESFDFSTSGAWAIIEGETRPILRMELDVLGNNGDGTYTISNAHQLQMIGIHAAGATTSGKTYTLANDINLGAALGRNSEIWRTVTTKDVNNLYGFSPIGTSANKFQGTFNGGGHVISGLTIHRPLQDNVGLFGVTSKATISNISINGGAITGKGFVGGLIGDHDGGSLKTDGTSINDIEGSIANVSFIGGTVTGSADYVGGLIGRHQGGGVKASYASVDVTGARRVGGLIGRTATTSVLHAVYATGNINGTRYVGGLVGISNGNVSTAYASGNVTNTDVAGQSTGGLFGAQDSGAITNVYATGNVEGFIYVGGLVGLMQNAASSISNAYATGTVTLITGGSLRGGLAGQITTNATITNSFWNKDNIASGFGSIITGGSGSGTGLTLAQFNDTAYFMDKATAAGWDFANVWAPPGNGYKPELYALSKVIRVHANDSATATYGATTGTWTGGTAPTPTIYGSGLNIFGQAYGSPDAFALSIGVNIAGRNAGTNLITQITGLTASGTNGYRFIYTAQVAVTQATLTITADSKTKVYGEADPALTYTPTGLVNGDTASVITGALTRVAGENVGAYAITQDTAFAAGGNYIINFVGANLNITPATLSITAGSKTKVYGDADPALTYTDTGWKNGDTNALLSGSLKRAAGENVGAYAITQDTAFAAGGNYIINYVGANFDITPASLTITADNITQTYDGVPWQKGTVSYAGFVAGEDESVLSGTLSWGDAYGQTAVGNYVITPGSLSSNNYNISWVSGVLSIIAPVVPDINPPKPVVPPAPVPDKKAVIIEAIEAANNEFQFMPSQRGCSMKRGNGTGTETEGPASITAASALMGDASNGDVIVLFRGAPESANTFNCNPDVVER